jgi:hypothetical protein
VVVELTSMTELRRRGGEGDGFVMFTRGRHVRLGQGLKRSTVKGMMATPAWAARSM